MIEDIIVEITIQIVKKLINLKSKKNINGKIIENLFYNDNGK